MVAEIIINSMAKQLNKTFDYIVPDNLINTVKIGNRVFVPFGSKNSATEGYIIGLKKNSYFAQIKFVASRFNFLVVEQLLGDKRTTIFLQQILGLPLTQILK